MLSIPRVRELLGSLAPASDAEVAEIRAMLYGLAEVVLDSVSERVTDGSQQGDRPAQEAPPC